MLDFFDSIYRYIKEIGDYLSRVMSELLGKSSFNAFIMIGIINKRKSRAGTEYTAC